MKVISESNSIEFFLIASEVKTLREEFKAGGMKIHEFNERVRKLFSKYNWTRDQYDKYRAAIARTE